MHPDGQQSEFSFSTAADADDGANICREKFNKLETALVIMQKDMENIKLAGKADLGEKMFTINAAIDQLKTHQHQMEIKQEKNEAQISVMQIVGQFGEKLERMGKEVEELRGKVGQLQAENDELKEENGKMKEEFEGKNEEMEEMKAEIEEMKEENAEFEKQIAKLKEMVAKLDGKNQKLAQKKSNKEYLISLRSKATGKFVTAEQGGKQPLVANRAIQKEWELFRQIHNNDGTISFRSLANNNFVHVDFARGGRLIASSNQIGHNEKFMIEKSIGNCCSPDDGSFVLIKAMANGKFVCADLNNGGILVADRDTPKSWEQFEMIY